MDLPIINKYDNMRMSPVWMKMYLVARFGTPVECGRVKAVFHKAVSYKGKGTLKSSPCVNMPVQVKDFTADEIIKKLKKCSVAGCGGAGYPTHKKLEKLKPGPVGKRTLIINAVECDIGLIHDAYILEHFFDEVEAAAKMLKIAFGFDNIIMGVSGKCSHKSDVIEIKNVTKGYPAGAERILIHLLTGKIISPEKMPTDYGYAVLNIQTMFNVYNAMIYGAKYEGKYITVANMLTKTAQPVYVPFGTDIAAIAREYLGEMPEWSRPTSLLAGGGALHGHVVEEGELTTSHTNFIAYGETPMIKETTDCMYCNACIRACPMEIKVRVLVDNLIAGYHEQVDMYSPEKCIGCNSCSYVCFYRRNNPEVILEFNKRRAEAVKKAEERAREKEVRENAERYLENAKEEDFF